MPRILIVEDERKVRRGLERGLQDHGSEVAGEATGEAGLERALTQSFDCIVLDLLLPGRNGLQVLGELRQRGNKVPVLILTARDAVEDRVIGLDAGADDYLVKPFAFAELLARLRVLLRRERSGTETVLRSNDLEVDLLNRRASRGGQELPLTQREFEVLVYLLRHKLAREDARAARQSEEPVELASLVEEVAETMRPLAEAKGIHLRTEANRAAWVRGDAARLREVFFNLLDNGIKYTSNGGEVEVQIGQNGSEAIVTVTDTGIGIPAEHLPHVFDRFYRVDKARSRAEGGTGLGLSIAQSTIVAHGGRIELISAPDQGTTCTVKLPVESKRH